jgi:hypothetical protein
MKKLLFVFLILGIGFTSCTKEETVQPQTTQNIFDLKKELVNQFSWKYISTEKLSFYNDNSLRNVTPMNQTLLGTYTITNNDLYLEIPKSLNPKTYYYSCYKSNDTIYGQYVKGQKHYPILIK